jgi:hypothetical protein
VAPASETASSVGTARQGRFGQPRAGAALIAAVALAGCGAAGDSEQSDGSSSVAGAASAPPAATSTVPSKAPSSKNVASAVGALCRTPCTDGQQDFVDRLKVVPRPRHSNLLHPRSVIVSMRVRLKNIGYTPAEIRAGGGKRSDFKLIDSRQRTLSPVEKFDTRNERLAQCPTLPNVTLLFGDQHTFQVCFVLRDSKDRPKVFRLRNLAEIGLR